MIHQDARVYQTKLAAGETVAHELRPAAAAFVHVATGAATVNGQKLVAGRRRRGRGRARVDVTGDEPGEVLLFDLA